MKDSRLWLTLVVVVLLGWLVWLLRPILMPFLVGAALAYLGDPLADRLEARGWSRTAAVILVFVSLSLLSVLGLMLVIPLLGQQIERLYALLPQMVDWAQQVGLPWIERTLNVPASELDLDNLRKVIMDNLRASGGIAGAVLAGVGRSGLAAVGLLASIALIPVVTFYLLRDWDDVILRIQDLLPRQLEKRLTPMAQECDEVVSAFLRGQLLVMLALAIIYATGLWLAGLDFALIIGLVAGLAAIVPYLGFIVGIGAATIAVLFQFDDIIIPLLLVWAVFGIGQMIEGALLTPLLVGDRIGLHPVGVIFAVLAGGQLFGFVGVLLALPVAAIIVVVLRHGHETYVASSFYTGVAGRSELAEGADLPLEPDTLSADADAPATDAGTT